MSIASKAPSLNTVTDAVVPHPVELSCNTDSKITKVHLYPGQAEITRRFAFLVTKGYNSIIIDGLPLDLRADSFQITGKGHATIHDVYLSVASGTIDLDALQKARHQEKQVEKRLKATEEVRQALASSMASTKLLDHECGTLASANLLDEYITAATKYDLKILELRKELDDCKGVSGDLRHDSSKKTRKATINVFADEDGEVVFIVKYAISPANWNPTYEIRVDTSNSDDAYTARISYKARIIQNTGEDWTQVPLALETASPSFGMTPPALRHWRVSEVAPPTPSARQAPIPMTGVPMTGVPMKGVPMSMVPTVMPGMVPTVASAPIIIKGPSRSRSRCSSPRRRHTPPPVRVVQMEVLETGSAPMGFAVPGLITVPSDGEAHVVNISELTVPSTLLRFVVPKLDPRVQLKSKITNETDYVIIPGVASIYVDGSFVGTTRLNRVNPQESFDCPMGFDHTIRVTYHPREKNVTTSGVVQKQTTHTTKQKITVQNTRATRITNLRVIDQIPISQSSKVEVKIYSPLLDSKNRASDVVRVESNVKAKWDVLGNDASDGGLSAPMDVADGQFSWLLDIPQKKSLSLMCHFDITHPRDLVVSGVSG